MTRKPGTARERRNTCSGLILLVFALLLACSGPRPEEFLDDQPGLLTAAEKQRLIRYNHALLEEMDIHFRLVILRAQSEDIDGLAVELFGRLGERTQGARGLLLLVDPGGGQVRVEVGYDLEHIFPDSFVGFLERAQMQPFFSAGKVGAGIEAVTELFVSRAQRAIDGIRFDPEQELTDLRHFSGGGGATERIAIGSRSPTKEHSEHRDDFQPQATPEASLRLYLQALRLRVKDPELPLFTSDTRAFFSRWVVTDAQQESELRRLSESEDGRYIVSGDLAVLRFPVMNRFDPPYFFQKGPDGWMLDFATMSRVLQMNHRNMWLMKSKDHPYMFAFSDWRFDRNGFPMAR